MKRFSALLTDRRVLAGLLTSGLLAVTAVAAVAYWTAGGSGGGSGTATTLQPPTAVITSNATGSTTVSVSWTAPTPPGGGAVDGYYVQRFVGTTPSNACGSTPTSLLAATPTSCSDTAVANGTYTYKVTAVFRTWTATSGSSAPVTVAKSTPSITTTPSAGVVVGGVVSDQASLTSAFSPTGSIVFTLYSNSGCSTQVFTSTNALSGTTATSGNFTTTVAGTFFWKASYAGDVNNTSFTTPCGTGHETVVVSKASPSITTTPSAGVVVSGVVSDQASLTGAFSPTGSIVFTLYSNSACSTQVFTSTNALSGTSATSSNFTTTAAGTFYWKASYASDANNNGFTTSCGTGQESVVVGAASPSITTTPSAGVNVGGVVSDQASLTSSFNPTGSIVFTLYSNSGCTTQVFTSTNAISGTSAGSSNFTTTAAGTFFWKTSYAGDANNSGFTTLCGTGQETVVVSTPGPLTPTSILISNHSGTAGKPDQGDTITIVWPRALQESSMCATWTNNSADPSLTTEVDLNRTGSHHSLVAVPGAPCSGSTVFNFGTLDTGADFISGTGTETSTFTNSTITYNHTTFTMVITLGTAGGQPTAPSTSSVTATYTPSTSITDTNGIAASGSVSSAREQF